MSSLGAVRTAVPRISPSPSSPPRPSPGITVYECDDDEAALFRELAPRFGLRVTVTDAPASEAGAGLAFGNRCVSIGHKTRATAATLRALRSSGAEYVSTRSVGYDHVDMECARRIGLTVGNVAYSPDSVADYTLMLMLMSLRGAKSVVRRTDRHDYRSGEVRGRELRDLTVGVVGTGRIGSAVLDRLRGFGCRTLTHDSAPRPGAENASLEVLVRDSDVVTLHTPLTASTRHLLDDRRISAMKQGAVVVNTGRGGLVDTSALLRALETGHLGGAALDVVEGEEGIFYTDCRERAVDNESLLRLQELPTVLISPHIAYYTEHALRDAVADSLANCREFENGLQHG